MPVVSYRMGPHPELLLCHAVVDTPTFAERVAAASSAGVQALGLDMTRRRRHHQLGETDESMRRDAAAAGVRVDELWSLYGVLDHTAAARTLAYADRLIEVAASFGALMIGAPADFDGDLVAASTLLAEVADRAARAGVRVGLEPVAFTRLDDVAVAATIVEACGRDNVGLVLDVWHLCRGRTHLQTIDDLKLFVVGADPMRVEHIWQDMYIHAFYRGGPILASAIITSHFIFPSFALKAIRCASGVVRYTESL